MKRFLITIGLILVVIAVYFGIRMFVLNTDEVEYRIEGTATSVLVTLKTSDGKDDYQTGVQLPHSFKYSSFEGSSLSVTAQNENSSGSVKVSIYYKGELVASDAGLAQASASYTKPASAAKLSLPIPALPITSAVSYGK